MVDSQVQEAGAAKDFRLTTNLISNRRQESEVGVPGVAAGNLRQTHKGILMSTCTQTKRLSDIFPERIARIDPYRRGTGLATDACTTPEEIADFIAKHGAMEMVWTGQYWHNAMPQPKWTTVIVMVKP